MDGQKWGQSYKTFYKNGLKLRNMSKNLRVHYKLRKYNNIVQKPSKSIYQLFTTLDIFRFCRIGPMLA